MDYKEKYEQALEVAKETYNKQPMYKDWLESMFHELKESEDERIRKAIHIYLDWLDGRNKDYQPKGDYSIKDMIAWLEKQCKQKSQGKSALEAINEEKVDNQNCVKPVDKVEPKFKVGEIIKITGINNGHTGYSILNTEDGYYYNWKLVDCKPAWSEKDEQHIDSLLKRLDGLCRNEFERTRFAISEDRDWLTSLKERIGGQL